MKVALAVEERYYEEVPDDEKFVKIIGDYMVSYNLEYPSKLDLVLFKVALQHTARIARILR